MKASVLEGAGHKLRLLEVPEPLPSPNDVIIELKAAALNHRDVWIQKGLYPGLNLAVTLGSDGSGVVKSCGSQVSEEWLNKAVIINPSIDWGIDENVHDTNFKILGLPEDGTFAECVRVPSSNIYPKPKHLTYEQAAALPLAGLTAYRALFSRAKLKPGEKILITGIGGGAALMAMQFALAAKANVYVTSSSSEKLSKAAQFGVKGGYLYTDSKWSEKTQKDVEGFDVIIDSAGGENFDKLISLANPSGRIVTFGATAGTVKEITIRKLFWKQLSILGSTMGSTSDFESMLKYVKKHKIVPIIDSTFPLQEAELAMRKMERGEQFGKIVLKVSN